MQSCPLKWLLSPHSTNCLIHIIGFNSHNQPEWIQRLNSDQDFSDQTNFKANDTLKGPASPNLVLNTHKCLRFSCQSCSLLPVLFSCGSQMPTGRVQRSCDRELMWIDLRHSMLFLLSSGRRACIILFLRSTGMTKVCQRSHGHQAGIKNKIPDSRVHNLILYM